MASSVADAVTAFRVAKTIELKRNNVGPKIFMRMTSKTESADREAMARHVRTFAPSFTVVDDCVVFDSDDAMAVVFFLLNVNKDEEPTDRLVQATR